MESRRKKVGIGVDPLKEGAPTYHSPYEGRFKDPNYAKRVLRAVANFFRSHSSTDSSESDFVGFAIEKTQIKPSREPRMRMETRFASGTVLLYVPHPDGESEEAFETKERKLLAEFQTTVYEAQMRSAFQFYFSLDEEGKKALESFADGK